MRLVEQLKGFIDPAIMQSLPSRYRKAVEHSVALYFFHEKKETVSFAPVFQPLLGPIDHAAEALMVGRLLADVPPEAAAQRAFFEPDLSGVKKSDLKYFSDNGSLLRKLLVYRSPIMPAGLLRFCLRYAGATGDSLGGVFGLVRVRFADGRRAVLLSQVEAYYEFRNTYIAHEKKALTDVTTTRDALRQWITTLCALHEAMEAVRPTV